MRDRAQKSTEARTRGMQWKHLREGTGALLIVAALFVLGTGIRHLRDQEFVGALLLIIVSLALVRAGVELLRPSMGE
jgi:hypothetical protein